MLCGMGIGLNSAQHLATGLALVKHMVCAVGRCSAVRGSCALGGLQTRKHDSLDLAWCREPPGS